MNAPGRDPHSMVPAAVAGTARLMAYALLAISLMTLDHRGHYVERVRAQALQLAEPIYHLVDLPFRLARQLQTHLLRQQILANQRDALTTTLMQLRAELVQFDDLQRENAELRARLGVAARQRPGTLAAELAAVDLDPFSHRILVRRGAADGVVRGMPVIDDLGVLGQVDRVLHHAADVVLITDPDHALPVQVQPGGERTIAYGSGAFDTLRLDDLPMNTRIEPGSLVVTSGLGGRFPAGLPVARVTRVQRPPGESFARAEARPLAAMGRNRFVLLLRPVEMEQPSQPPPETRSEIETHTETGISADAVESGTPDTTDGTASDADEETA
ncbi:MAG: rod shape-determining protein MreC [Wenzhouxiangellaceae bacterium]|nr:rod shape-determining protein MreC [Wenzhouxiangellaceae bacterium]